jgi:hypothetical protein
MGNVGKHVIETLVVQVFVLETMVALFPNQG